MSEAEKEINRRRQAGRERERERGKESVCLCGGVVEAELQEM